MHHHPRPQQSALPGVALIIVAALVCAFGFCYLLYLGSPAAPKTPKQIENKEGESAYYMGREFIKQTLKAPSTANFPRSSAGWRKIRKGLFHVWGEVDAQNSFGVPLRNEWECAVTQLANGRWLCLWRRLGDDQSSERPKYLDDPSNE